MTLRKTVALGMAVASGLLGCQTAKAGECGAGTPHAEKLGWHVGCQAYSFNRFTFFEAVDKVNSLGLHYIEMYPGQPLSPQHTQTVTGVGMTQEERSLVKDKLKASDIKVVNFGVVELSADSAQCRQVFDFAKDMGIQTLCAEPAQEDLDMIDGLAQEYKINVALHNHPTPSRYWDPQVVLDACQGRSKYIGACADTGHWLRSGINPLEAIKMLKGRIISFHFKDLNQADMSGHDVPWGTGQADVKALLEEIHSQGLSAVFSVEYEYHWEDSVPEIAQSVAYFDQVTAQILASEDKKSDGQ